VKHGQGRVDVAAREGLIPAADQVDVLLRHRLCL
jgi:hypothetical protein